MSIPVEILEAEVLNLPAADRSRLLDRLVLSLDPDPIWEEEWAREAERRESLISEGKAHWLSGEAVVASLRLKIK